MLATWRRQSECIGFAFDSHGNLYILTCTAALSGVKGQISIGASCPSSLDPGEDLHERYLLEY